MVVKWQGKRRGGKKIAKFSKKMQKKLVVLFVIIALLLLGLIVRLMYIEHTSGKKYRKESIIPSRNMTVRSFLISVEILQTARERYWQPAWMYTM